MAIPTTKDLKDIISVGTYNLNFEFFDYLQLENRRRFPSIDLEKINPQAKDRTRDKDVEHYQFQINIYEKVFGTENEENPNQEQAEQQIITLLEGATLGNHKIVIESKNWSRERVLERHPYYIVSSLIVTIRSISVPTLTPTGFLIFNKANSKVDNPPASDFVYTHVFDVQINDGYRDIHEYVGQNPDGDKLPIGFAGGYNGTFIANVPIQAADIGATGDKINQLKSLRSNGEKPDIYFVYNDKDDTTPNPSTITETGIRIRIDSIGRNYSSSGNVVWRIIGRCMAPPAITTT